MYLLLFLGGVDEEQFEIRRADVGEDVTLTCARNPTGAKILFWTKFAHGSLPDVLGSTPLYESKVKDNSSRIICEQGPGTFLLRILKVTPNDQGFYYCFAVEFRTIVFLKWTFLRIQGKDDLK